MNTPIFVTRKQMEATSRIDDIDHRIKILTRRTSVIYTILSGLIGALSIELVKAIFHDWYAILIINTNLYIVAVGFLLIILVSIFVVIKWRAEKDLIHHLENSSGPLITINDQTSQQ